MKHIRPIDWDQGTDAGIAGYRGQILYAGESCYVIATRVPPGVEGPTRHTHASDQIYAVLEGTTTVELGAEARQVSRFGSVFIPAGVPHHNRNDADVDEVHIEVIAPGGFLQPIATPTDSTDAKGLPYFTKDFTASGNGRGMSVSYLANRESGSVHASIYLAAFIFFQLPHGLWFFRRACRTSSETRVTATPSGTSRSSSPSLRSRTPRSTPGTSPSS